ncbi:hypothetical protein J6P92_00665 [bacterium]|nr:hypothetical protein [bacterium]
MSIRTSVVNSYHNFQQRVLNMFPNSEYSNPNSVKHIKKVGEKISSAEQRLILGASALISQPFIDFHNRDVDEETRKVSVCRTIAKIIAGTTTGFLIRKGCIKAIKEFSQIPAKGVPKYKTIFTPKNINDAKSDAYAQYRNAMGTVVALVVMMITNFAIDAPLTKFLTNLLVKKQEDKK